MILNRFGVRGKLNLLLLLPLIAVLLVATPLVVGQIDDARSAGRTADSAGQARQLGALVSELQRELLVTSAYVASPVSDPSAMLEQQRTVADSVERVRAALGSTASDELTAALTRIGSLDELRRNAVTRGVSLDSLARTYHAVTEAMVDALRLIPRNSAGTVGTDAESTQALVELDALLRANEQSALRGTALITAAVSPVAGRNLLNDSTSQAQFLTQRFVQQADIGHAELVVLVDQGDAGREVEALSRQVPPVGNPAATSAFISSALASAESQASLRRAVQDRVTTQLADAAASRSDSAGILATAVGVGVAALLGLVVLLSVIVSQSIAGPLHRLTRSATAVADLARTELTRVADSEDAEEQLPQLPEIDMSSGGEVGQLAAAFNRVQSTAAELLNRQSTNRRNVSLMFANVARRTQNLVHRQLTVVDELEHNEQDPNLLNGLYRLDHLSTRLRRSADKLLVVAGSREQAMITGPIELGTALRSALAEIEDYKRVRFGTLCNVTLASPVAADLVLVFAELLENATAFSPPDFVVDLSARIQKDGACLILIVDRGVGMTSEQLAEENRRLVERERLDIAPTGVLGLFVVGRLARRHSLNVGLVETPGGGITALVTIPPELFFSHAGPQPGPLPVRPAAPTPRPTPPPVPTFTIPPPRSANDGFVWFEMDIPTAAPVPAAVAAHAPVPAHASSPAAPTLPPLPAPAPGRPAQPTLGYQPAAASAGVPRPVGPRPGPEVRQPLLAPSTATPDTPAGPGRGGLHRRVPGAQIPSTAGAPTPGATPERPRHDAAAARFAMDNYQSALAEAARRRDPQPSGRQSAGPRRPSPQPVPPQLRSVAPTVARAPGAPPRHGAPPRPGATATTSTRDDAGGERRAGLSRRIPGTHLAPGLSPQQSPAPADIDGSPWGARDAEAERLAFDGFAAGLARADASVDTAAAATAGDGRGIDSKGTTQ